MDSCTLEDIDIGNAASGIDGVCLFHADVDGAHGTAEAGYVGRVPYPTLRGARWGSLWACCGCHGGAVAASGVLGVARRF